MSSKYPYMDADLDLESRVEDLLNRLTLEEKISLCAGWGKKTFVPFFTHPIERLGIKPFKMTDGPHGLGTGSSNAKRCTYFPVAICRAATWNPLLSEKFGVAVAQEVREIGYHMLLAPGINIQRTPLCGRTFEYQTEDPYLNKVLAVAVVKGIQNQRIGACVKHFICNNQDANRFRVSSEVSERALQEIYFPAFQATVREADVWAFMSCYNKVNGIFGSEHKHLLRDVLMDEWGFRGFVVSDWGATASTKTRRCVNAGLSLEMPYPLKLTKRKILKALEKERITEGTLNDNIRRILRVMFLVGLFDDESNIPPGSRNTSEHQKVASEIAAEGIVLLKNTKNLLPLNIKTLQKIAVLGPNAEKKHAGGGGSSAINASYEITPLEGLKEKIHGKFGLTTSVGEADIAIIFAGLNHDQHNDAEGIDRIALDLPQDQVDLINQTVEENPNTIVVLINGSPIAMSSWIDKVPVVLEAWYPGCNGGHVIADTLFGEVNPSGKLPITFPKKLEDSPAHKSSRTYPGEKNMVYYEEEIFVGYRYFDTNHVEPLFPFGHGLSYTTFVYENLQIHKKTMSKDEKLLVTCDIKNTGIYPGAEVIQLYIQDVESSVERPFQELKGFLKIKLNPGEKKSVNFEITTQDLSFFDENNHCWTAEKGIFKILIGSSSRDIRLRGEIEFVG